MARRSAATLAKIGISISSVISEKAA